VTSRRGGEDPQLTALVGAIGVARPIEPRLTGGFAYAPVPGAMRSARGEPVPLSPDARIAIANIEKGKPDSANELRTRAIAALMIAQAEFAVTTLEDAARRQPNDARILSDLSAAYLTRAERTKRIEDNQLALGNATKALEIDRVLPTALFNRALALERLGQTEDARKAWEFYLTIDERSGWADEARAHLRILAGQQP
jgi:tetratricopeptide (TPR) repeat protein